MTYYVNRLGLTVLVVLLLAGCSDNEKAASVNGLDTDWMVGAAATAEDVHPLLPGMNAPSFTAKMRDGSEYIFDADSLQKPAVVIFYRGGWCPYCSRQLMELQDIDQDLVEMGYDLLLISADSPERLSEGVVSDDVPFTLLSDARMDVSKAFGIAYRVDDATIQRYMESGLDLAEEAGYGHYLLPAPSAYIIDSNGLIQFQYTNPNYRVRIKSELLTTAAQLVIDDMDM